MQTQIFRLDDEKCFLMYGNFLAAEMPISEIDAAEAAFRAGKRYQLSQGQVYNLSEKLFLRLRTDEPGFYQLSEGYGNTNSLTGDNIKAKDWLVKQLAAKGFRAVTGAAIIKRLKWLTLVVDVVIILATIFIGYGAEIAGMTLMQAVEYLWVPILLLIVIITGLTWYTLFTLKKSLLKIVTYKR